MMQLQSCIKVSMLNIFDFALRDLYFQSLKKLTSFKSNAVNIDVKSNCKFVFLGYMWPLLKVNFI